MKDMMLGLKDNCIVVYDKEDLADVSCQTSRLDAIAMYGKLKRIKRNRLLKDEDPAISLQPEIIVAMYKKLRKMGFGGASR